MAIGGKIMVINKQSMSKNVDKSQANQWDWPLSHTDDFVDVISNDEKFEVQLEVQLFKPNEISVRVCAEELVISCRSEPDPKEYKMFGREVHRAYRLPRDVDTLTLKTTLQKGRLCISAKKKQPSTESKDKK